MVLRIVIFVIAAVLTAAHFLRGGSDAMVALSLAVPLLFLCKKRWSLPLNARVMRERYA